MGCDNGEMTRDEHTLVSSIITEEFLKVANETHKRDEKLTSDQMVQKLISIQEDLKERENRARELRKIQSQHDRLDAMIKDMKMYEQNFKRQYNYMPEAEIIEKTQKLLPLRNSC